MLYQLMPEVSCISRITGTIPAQEHSAGKGVKGLLHYSFRSHKNMYAVLIFPVGKVYEPSQSIGMMI